MSDPALYVHIPFCSSKCLFCSFAIAVGQTHRAGDYLDALEQEAGRYDGRAVSTVYLGGGTPSLLDAVGLRRLTGILRSRFRIPPDAEFTIEVNPETVNTEKVRLLKDLGINRVSLGVQSLQDRYLKFLGRGHDSETAARAVETIRAAGFGNVSLDLMYSFPQQTESELKNDVEDLLRLSPDHVSLYTLTIEENSRFYARQMKLDADEVLADHYLLIADLLAHAGFQQYEISNFAKPGFESRHNLNYWEGGEYIGLGMGAHSHLNDERFWNAAALPAYLQKVRESRNAIEGSERLSPGVRLMERVLFGLRMNRGIDVKKLEDACGCALEPGTRALIEEYVAAGFLHMDGTVLTATLKGRLVLDELSARLI